MATNVLKNRQVVLVAQVCKWNSCTPTLSDVQALGHVAERELEDHGFESFYRQMIFLANYPLVFTCMIIYVKEFLQFINVSFKMSHVYSR